MSNVCNSESNYIDLIKIIELCAVIFSIITQTKAQLPQYTLGITGFLSSLSEAYIKFISTYTHRASK